MTFFKLIIKAPYFALGIFLGILKAILTEPPTFLLFLFSLFLGIFISYKIGLMVGIGLYTFILFFNGYLQMILRSRSSHAYLQNQRHNE